MTRESSSLASGTQNYKKYISQYHLEKYKRLEKPEEPIAADVLTWCF